ncbi:DUF4167 domain-containing protein [uncultured Cohaesibacter sp.]|uniref:DUF4167 domain-containing protein n=1 Tax=uncultured Cohaesibacter sp. TaxID=1002546 RepID=UPI002AA77070|nr:DUF4167 domain-containing protein [uncultured Cohaesibacter sp.]
MRQSQKNSRTRSRGRKPSNPLSRSYDSNGPDVKIRGTASHIAEKYQSLARDALASGDMVMSENYYQHAEHYLRIIAAAQPSTRDDVRNTNANSDQPSNSERPARAKPAPQPEITGDEPQPEISGFENTAVEMEVAVIEKPEEEEQQPEEKPKRKRTPKAAADTEEDGKDGAPRRRRRTTYRSRKRPATGEKQGDAVSAAPATPPAASEAPQPVAAEE